MGSSEPASTLSTAMSVFGSVPTTRALRSEGIADGQHVVAYLHLVGIANSDGLERAGVHLEYRNVGLRIGAHYAGFEIGRDCRRPTRSRLPAPCRNRQ